VTTSAEGEPGSVFRWALRTSFREYIAALDDGGEEASEGAIIGDDGRFVMQSDPAPDVPPLDDRVLPFRGTVSFRGHSGLLAVVLRDPWIHLAQDGSGTVTVVVSRGRQGGGRRSVIASFEESRTTENLFVIGEPKLTSAGVATLGDVYQPGDLLDPIEIQMNVTPGRGNTTGGSVPSIS
jgi:hypothetical protein